MAKDLLAGSRPGLDLEPRRRQAGALPRIGERRSEVLRPERVVRDQLLGGAEPDAEKSVAWAPGVGVAQRSRTAGDLGLEARVLAGAALDLGGNHSAQGGRRVAERAPESGAIAEARRTDEDSLPRQRGDGDLDPRHHARSLGIEDRSLGGEAEQFQGERRDPERGPDHGLPRLGARHRLGRIPGGRRGRVEIVPAVGRITLRSRRVSGREQVRPEPDSKSRLAPALVPGTRRAAKPRAWTKMPMLPKRLDLMGGREISAQYARESTSSARPTGRLFPRCRSKLALGECALPRREVDFGVSAALF